MDHTAITQEIERQIAALDLAMPVPEQEPLRQYYFIKYGRLLVDERKRRLGRELTYCVNTFGCQMNARDSEKLTGILTMIGFMPADSENADFVIYNTCTVRENANNKVYGHLGYLKGYKKKNPQMMIALCGCMMQEPSVVAKIRESFSFVDLIFGTHNIYRFAELITQAMCSEQMVVDLWEDKKRIVEHLPNQRKYPFKTGINITYGCNNFCSYCIVPYVRGREWSRKPEEILEEIRSFAGDGVVEVMLLGQNVNSYGRTLDEPVSFAQLLAMVEAVDGIKRIRFMTSHPKDLSDELIRVMAASEKICRHIHLPLQSGSSDILKAMNRRYNKEQYLALTDKLRKAMPDIAITTDIIVGFPGETEADFEETLDVVKRVGFDSAFTFIYSKRTGTPAAAMENQVPQDVVDERFARLLTLVSEKAGEKARRLTGRIEEVLAEEVNRQDPAFLSGRLSNNSIVHFPGDRALIGSIVKVRLDECRGFYYIGSCV